MTDSGDLSRDRSLQRAKQFDALCDEFEALCLKGERPTIESFLSRFDGPDKQPLLVELIALEMHYRRRQGVSIAIAEYQARFPGLSASRLEETIQLSVHKPPRDQGKPAAQTDVPTVATRGGNSSSDQIQSVKYFGDYELLNVIARGGMGIVYKARQVSLDRIVALKMILSGDFASKEEVERFYSEAKAAALLDHPSIVPIFEVGEHEGKHFFSMAYVDGSSLASKLSDGPLEPMQAAQTLFDVSQAVQYAHEQGVIHRDLKPSNILLDLQGRPRVTDFGLAKRLAETSGMTVSGQVLGTPSYMPPEQAAGQISTIGPASDVYALGAVLYSLTTGRPPFQAASSLDTLRQVIYQEPVAPRQLNPSIPLDLETIIMKCLEKALPRRFLTVKALAEELHRFLNGMPIQSRPVSRVERLWRMCNRQPAVASLSALAILLLASLLVGTSWAYLREAAYREDLQVSFNNEKDAKDAALEASQKADKEAKLAEEARQEKERQAEIAAQERDNAKTSEAAMRRNLYISDIGRAQEAIQSSNYARASTLLERHRPTSDQQPDLRSLDWHLLQNQIAHPKASWTFKKPVEVVAISPDQSQVAVGCEGGRAYVVDISTGKVCENLPYFLDEEHWATIGFRHDGTLVAHGRLGSIKFWDVSTGNAIAHKPRNYSSQFNNYRIPAAISQDGTRMIGSDDAGLLALWNLNTLRPQQIPFVNEGFHYYAANMPIYFSMDMSKNLQALKLDFSLATDAGYKDMGEFLLAKHVQSMPRGYAPVGWGQSIPTMDTLQELGHPATSMALQDGMVVLGKSNGEIELLKQSELEIAQEWANAEMRKKRALSRPINSVTYISEVNAVVATDGMSCVLLNANLKPIMAIPSSRAPFSEVCAVGQGRFAVGRKDGVVEIWSAIDEIKTLELQSGTSDVSGMTVLKDSTSLLVSNLDGTVGLFSLATEQNELVPSRGVLSDYQTSPLTMFWQTSNKSLAIHQSLGGEFKQFRLADWRAPQKSNVASSNSLLLSVDYMRPAIYHEQPQAKRLLGVFSRQLRLLDTETLEVLRNIDVTARQGKDYSVLLFKQTDNHFHHQSVSVEASALSTALRSTTFRTLEILAADDFPDEKQVVLAIGDTTNVPRHELRLFIRNLDEDKLLSEVAIDGAQVYKSTFQLTAIDNARVILDGVVFSGDANNQHTLLYDIPEAVIQVIDTRPFDASKQSSFTDPSPQIFNFVDSLKKIVIQDRLEIRVLDTETLLTTRRLKALPSQQFEFAYLSNEGVLCAVIKSSSSNFSWSTWNDTAQKWDQVFAGIVQPSNSIVSDYRWCFDPDRSILFHLASPFEVQRWICRTGDLLPSLHLPEVNVQKVVANGSESMVAWSESKAPTSLFSQTPPWSTSWFRGNTAVHELIQTSLYDKRPPYFLPLTPTKNCWLTSNGLKWDMKGTSPNSILEIEGKKAPWSTVDFRGSQLLLSSNSQVLVELKSNAVESWQLTNSPAEQLPIRFVSRGSHPLTWQPRGTGPVAYMRNPIVPETLNSNQPRSPDRFSCVSQSGRILALLADEKIQFSIQPFKDWKSIDPSVIKVDDVTAMTCMASETSILVGLKDGDIVEIQSDDRSLIRYPKGHLGPVTSLLAMPDGKTFVSGGKDGNIAVWDISQKEMRLSVPAHRGAVNSLFWNQASEELLSAGDDGFVRKWPAVSSTTTEDKVESQFLAPNPTDPWKEIKSKVDPKVQINRNLAVQLQKRNIGYQTLNFGMRVYTRGDLSSFDQLAIDAIEITPQSNLDGFDFAELQGLSELRSIKISYPELTSQSLSKLVELASVYKLEVSGAILNDLQFERFTGWKNLRVLNLQNCGITDSQLKAIAENLPQLLELNLTSAATTDQSAELIGKLQQLEILNISNTALTDAVTPHLKNLKRIEQLNLNGTKITNQGIQQLKELRLLKSIAVRGLEVQPGNFLELWPRLRTMDLRETLASSHSIRGLLNHRNVSVLVSPSVFKGIREAEILAQLGPLPAKLEVDGVSMEILDALTKLGEGSSITSIVWPAEQSQSPENAALLQALPNLQSLTISKNAIPERHFLPLQKLAKITKLDLTDLPATTPDAFALLCKIPSISSVQVKRLDKDLLTKLGGMPNLRSLEYSDGEDLSVVAVALPGLKHISCGNELNPAKLAKVAKDLSQLESLTTSEKPSAALLKALAKMPTLKSLQFQRKLSDKEIGEVKSYLPSVTLE